mgnify:CR=1 FL=1
MEITRINAEIKKERPDVKAVFFVGCGASKAELYPALDGREGENAQSQPLHSK